MQFYKCSHRREKDEDDEEEGIRWNFTREQPVSLWAARHLKMNGGRDGGETKREITAQAGCMSADFLKICNSPEEKVQYILSYY